MLAFHEGFADLCALFSHFSQHDSVIDAIHQTGGQLYQTELNPVAGDAANKDQARLTAEIRQLIDTIRTTGGATNKIDLRDAANDSDDDDQPAITAEIPRMNPLIQLAIQFGQNGTLCYDGDLTPFGGERAYTNTCAQNYKFEGKERDTETQNDDFGARYYSWRFGRWLSSDWSAVTVPVPYANLTNPQTLNLYSMALEDDSC